MNARLPMPRPESPSDLFGTLQREVNRVFDQMFGGRPLSATGFAPSVDVKETAEGLERLLIRLRCNRRCAGSWRTRRV